MARRLIWLAAAAMLAVTTPALAQGKASDVTVGAVAQAADRGGLIYAYDQAAWHGTDDMLSKIPHPEQVVGGWIVDGPRDAPELVFYDRDPADPHAVYVADFRDGRLVSSHVPGAGEDRTLSPERKRMIAAKDIARGALVDAKVERCVEKPFNTVVLPAAAPGGPILVYFLTPQTDMKVIPFGGHYLFEVSADGKAGPVRRFTNSCIAMSVDGPRAGDKPVAMVISHLLDPMPTEIHVFSSLAAHKTVYVITVQNQHLWAVEGTTIRLVQDKVGK